MGHFITIRKTQLWAEAPYWQTRIGIIGHFTAKALFCAMAESVFVVNAVWVAIVIESKSILSLQMSAEFLKKKDLSF